MNILLYAPEYRPNLSNMIRSAEFFGYKKIYIYDNNDLLNPPNNKTSRAEMQHMARVWTAGAVDHLELEVISNPLEFITQYKGRVIGTMLDKSAQHLADFEFEKDDLIIMGSEKEGLPKEVANSTTQNIYIPQIGVTDCLNVSVTLGIVLHEAQKYQ